MGNLVSFMSANFVARQLGYRMTEGWSQGDEATSRHFRPPATFRERFEAVVRDVAALGFRAMDVWTAHLSPRWATPEHLVAARDVLDHHGLSVPSIAGSFGADRAEFDAACRNVLRHLAPGGVFVFDANTELALRELWVGGKVEGWADDVYYSWRHTYDEAAGLAYVEAYCSTPQGSFVERHAERGYAPGELRSLVEGAGFADVAVVTYPDGEPAGDDADRVWVAARRP